MVFARETSDTLTSLVKKLDEANQKNKSLNSFVVFMNDDEKLEDQLKALSEKADLKKTVLTIDNPSGPAGYKVAKEADVTVVLYNNRKVEVNHAFAKGKLDAKAVEQIISDLDKITD